MKIIDTDKNSITISVKTTGFNDCTLKKLLTKKKFLKLLSKQFPFLDFSLGINNPFPIREIGLYSFNIYLDNQNTSFFSPIKLWIIRKSETKNKIKGE